MRVSFNSSAQRAGALEAFSLRADAQPSTGPVIRLIVAYDVLYMAGFVTLLAVILTAYYSRTTQRSSLWFLGVSSWAVISFANILLLGQQVGPQPALGYCLSQATLIYASPAYSASANAAYMFQAYFCLTSAAPLKRLSRSRPFNILLHTVPGAILFGIVLEVVILGLSQRNTIERDISGMYCHLDSSLPGRVTAAVTIIGMSSILVLEILIFRLIRQTKKEVISASSSVMMRQDDFSREIFTRMAFFCSWAVVCIGLSFIVYLPQSKINNTEAQIAQATLPCVATLTFGTQKDVMSAWKSWFWPKDKIASELKFQEISTAISQ